MELGLKGGFPLSEIFRPNRNFSLFHELSSRTNCKKTKRNFVSVEKFRLVESGLKAQFHEAEFFDRNEIFFCLTSTQMELIFYLLNLNNRNFVSVEKFRLVESGLKAQFHEAEFFDRNEIFFCLTSTQMELIFYLLNLNNRNFGSIEQFRLVENRLKGPIPRGGIFRPKRNFLLSDKHSDGTKGPIPRGGIFRPKRNFLLSDKHSDGTNLLSFEFEQ